MREPVEESETTESFDSGKRTRIFPEALWQHLIEPSSMLLDLVSDPRRLVYGPTALMIPVILYAMAILFLALSGAEPAANSPPFLPIPLKDHYFAEVFFIGLVMVAGWILASCTIQAIEWALPRRRNHRGHARCAGFWHRSTYIRHIDPQRDSCGPRRCCSWP